MKKERPSSPDQAGAHEGAGTKVTSRLSQGNLSHATEFETLFNQKLQNGNGGQYTRRARRHQASLPTVQQEPEIREQLIPPNIMSEEDKQQETQPTNKWERLVKQWTIEVTEFPEVQKTRVNIEQRMVNDIASDRIQYRGTRVLDTILQSLKDSNEDDYDSLKTVPAELRRTACELDSLILQELILSANESGQLKMEEGMINEKPRPNQTNVHQQNRHDILISLTQFADSMEKSLSNTYSIITGKDLPSLEAAIEDSCKILRVMPLEHVREPIIDNICRRKNEVQNHFEPVLLEALNNENKVEASFRLLREVEQALEESEARLAHQNSAAFGSVVEGDGMKYFRDFLLY